MTKNIFFDFWGTLSYLEQGIDFGEEISKIFGIKKEEYLAFVEDVWFKRDVSPEQFALLLTTKFSGNESDIGRLIELIKNPLKRTQLYPETIKTLERLYPIYDLFIISDTSSVGKEAVKNLDLVRYFKRLFFSCDYNMRKNEGLYKRAFSELGIKPSECLVVGNSIKSDYEIPKNVGARALLLDREGKLEGLDLIRNLEELLR